MAAPDRPTGLIAKSGIELLTFGTPNGHKASIILEELKEAYGKEYTFQSINIMQNIQKEPWFIKINPNGRIPALVDHDRNDFPVFEGAAILTYLTRYYDPENKFSFDNDPDDLSRAEQWIAWQTGGIGPMQGQANHFLRAAKEDSPWGIQRYVGETERLYGVLDAHLKDRDYIVGPGRGKYSIADIANFGWINMSLALGIDLEKQFPNVFKWWERIYARPAVKKGLAVPSESRFSIEAIKEQIKENPEFKENYDKSLEKINKAKEKFGKHDYDVYKSLFALYLDIQKGKVLDGLDETEAKGRWKSFLGKWNRGELSKHWYDPSTLQRSLHGMSTSDEIHKREERARQGPDDVALAGDADTSSDDDSIGPTLPGQESRSRGSSSRMGPSIPNIQDLELKREMEDEDKLTYRDSIRQARKAERKAQKAALDELVPRAEPGTRERQLEKKTEINAKMKGFREKSPGAALEIPDSELMGGGGDDGVEGYKKKKAELERRKTEREIRKEEILRARMEEREERLREHREKENKTIEMLRQLAKERFG
ncbi:hypothetical protein B7463_g985, partial [Scytalidium lignicola]